MAQIMSSKGQQPRQESEQADIRGQLSGRIPTGARDYRNLHVAARGGGLEADGEADLRRHRILQRLRTGAHENAGSRAARVDLRELKVVTRVGESREVRTGDQIV